MPILGIFVDSTSKTRALNRACLAVAQAKAGRPSLVVTPNPEIIVAAQKDKSLEAILNRADLALPDGIGVVMAMRYLGMGPPSSRHRRGLRRDKGIFRPITLLAQGLWVGLSLFINRKWLFGFGEVVPGRWLFEELVRISAKEGKRVFLLGGKPGIAEKAARVLNAKWPMLDTKYNTGPWLTLDGRPQDEKQEKIEKETIEQINAFRPHFLFVGFGHPKQEKWLSRNLPKLNVGLAITVGGAFDYLAGSVPDPPQRLTQAGLEWLWRLLTQPRRIKRIFTAVVVFPFKLYLYRLGFPRL